MMLPPRGANGEAPLGDEEAQVEGALRARRQRRLQVDPAGAAVEHGQSRPEAVTGCELCLLYFAGGYEVLVTVVCDTRQSLN